MLTAFLLVVLLVWSAHAGNCVVFMCGSVRMLITAPYTTIQTVSDVSCCRNHLPICDLLACLLAGCVILAHQRHVAAPAHTAAAALLGLTD
jgi:hypothetical protein